MHGDGNGWVTCGQGHEHWGRHGAAGLLLQRCTEDGREVLMQHRAEQSHHGGTWGLPGGARDSHESAEHAAVREAGEEAGVAPDAVRVTGELVDDHGGWSYVTVLAEPTGRPLDPRPTAWESQDIRWVAVESVERLPLHPGFAVTWPLMRDTVPVTVVIDAANVVGARPDGWWRDREGAARRLLGRVRALAHAGLGPGELPDGVGVSGISRVFPRLVMVVEGRASPVARDDGAADGPVEVIAAAGSGDDTIVATAADLGGDDGPVLVVTADRGLRDRLGQVGAEYTGPRWLLDLLDRVDASTAGAPPVERAHDR